MVDTPDSKSGGASRGGSSPPTGTTIQFSPLQYHPLNPINTTFAIASSSNVIQFIYLNLRVLGIQLGIQEIPYP